MKRKTLIDLPCPVARSLEHVGEWWNILILRQAVLGTTRFDDFQKTLGIAPNMLTRRLNGLVESGLLERRLYNERPPRHDYVLTARGRDFRPVLWTLLAWGNRHFAPEGASITIVDTETGREAVPTVIDAESGLAIDAPRFAVVPGPAATEELRRALMPRGTAESGEESGAEASERQAKPPEGQAKPPRRRRSNAG